MNSTPLPEVAGKVLRIEAEAIERLVARLEERFEKAADLLHGLPGRGGHRIASLMVTDVSGRIRGIIHLHDLWGTEMF